MRLTNPLFIALLLTVSALSAANSYASSSTTTKLTEQLQHCQAISENQVRLACYDDIVKAVVTKKLPLAKSTVVKPAKSASVMPVISSAEKTVSVITTTQAVDETASFAEEQLKPTEQQKAQEVTSITATITKAKQLLRGQWVIYLENGQKWQQKDKAKMKLKVGDKIRLKKAAMGAIYLYKVGSHRSIRVKRLL